MAYLFQNDYEFQIQDTSLLQLIGSNPEHRIYSEGIAFQEIKGYVSQRYDTDREFRDIAVYDPLKTDYKALQRVVLDYPLWDGVSTFATGTYIAGSDKNVYKALSGNTNINPVGTTGTWQYVDIAHSMYLAKPPVTEFDWYVQYPSNSTVFYKDFIYTGSGYNVLPDDLNATYYWTKGAAYVVPSDSLLTASVWDKKDDRDKKVIECATTISLIKLVKRISPKNFPTWLQDSYRGTTNFKGFTAENHIDTDPTSVVGWLNLLKTGDASTSMKLLPKNNGSRIRMVTNNKKTNSY